MSGQLEAFNRRKSEVKCMLDDGFTSEEIQVFIMDELKVITQRAQAYANNQLNYLQELRLEQGE